MCDPHNALLNWGLWARSPTVNLEIPEPPAYAEWRPVNDWDDGWGDYEAPPSSCPMPIDEQQAMQIDKLLLRLSWEHWRTIYHRYFLLHHVHELALGAAHRALSDLIDHEKDKQALDRV